MKMVKILFLVVFTTLCLVGNSSAQLTGKPILVQKQVKLPTAQDNAKIFNRERVQIAALSQNDKLQIINDALKEKGFPKASILMSPLKLSTMNPKPNAENFLMYFKPWNAMVIGDSVQFSGAKSWDESSLAISFKSTLAGNYLFDLSVKKIEEMSFTIFTIDGKNQQTVKYPQTKSDYAHITFMLNFAETKQQAIFILADKDWSFFDCEISQIK
jgi:hypothetical protein